MRKIFSCLDSIMTALSALLIYGSLAACIWLVVSSLPATLIHRPSEVLIWIGLSVLGILVMPADHQQK